MSALPTMQIDTWKDILARRGILEAALDCGWTYREHNGAPGWEYPLLRFNGQQFEGVKRWKALDRNTAPQAYAWLDRKKPDDCQYYWARGIKEALDNSWGVLYITAGEPDMLSLIASGRRNVTSFFGEQNIPDSIVKDLQRIGITQVIYLPDLDNTGIDAAQKLLDKLDGVIPCDVKRLPGVWGLYNVKDANDLWRAVDFKADVFHEVIDNAPLWSFAPEQSPVKAQAAGAYYNYEAYAEAVEKALNLTGEKRNGWSKPIPCIFANHTHDDKAPSAGWHFKTHTFCCFKCGETWGCDEVAQRLGVDLEQFNENAGKTRGATNITLLDKAAQPAMPFAYSSDDSLTRYRERLEGKHISDVTAIPFPFKMLHNLGGFCEILKPRKMVGVIGLSGGGKTSFLEALTDTLREDGAFHTLWWGNEWRWDEMADRAVQRQGGLSMSQMSRLEMYLAKVAKGIHPGQKLIDDSLAILDKIAAWKGKAFYINRPGIDLGAVLEQAQLFLDEKKAQGMPIRIAVWDYASLFEVRGARGEMEKISAGLGMVKAFGEVNDLCTFVSSQPRKDDATKAKEGEKLLNAEDAMYMNDHKFNLLLTLNPQYVDGKIQNWGVVNVVKNSGGDVGKVSVPIDFTRMLWLDKPIPNGWGK